MARQAIRHEGDNAERSFRRLVKNSRSSPDSKRGDALVLVDNEWYFVEIKECHSNTINQVRAIKFISLIIYSPENSPPWVVIPPHEVVKLVSAKSRGQHTEIPFESANLSLSQLPDSFRCDDGGLEQKVIQAIRDGSNFAEVKETMENLRNELVELGSRTKTKVAEIFRHKR